MYISNFYKKLFGAPVANFVSLHENRVGDLPQLGTDENEVLSVPLSEKEVFESISQMKNNKAPHPDDFPAEFYKECWDIIQGDLMSMFHDLFNGQLQLFKLNFGTVTLLPKKEEAVCIVQFRRICLLIVSFKIFTKVGTNCLTQIANSVVQPTQKDFMLGRHIVEGVVILHETLHEIDSKNLDGVVFKVDFKKAYNKSK